ncbi:MAG: aspartyl protease family protein [Bacteroidales bacterium]
MKVFLSLIVAFSLTCQLSIAERKKKPISIPFEIVGSYVIVKLEINNSNPLNLILDSGVRNTIITELTPDDSISLNYSNSSALKGLGNGSELQALTSYRNSMKIGKMLLEDQTIIVLEKDVFNLSKFTGTKINGLLGSDIFQSHIVEINYDRKRLLFHDPEGFVVPANYTPIYLSIEGQKMFVQIPITEENGTKREAKMLVDTGAELAAWFRSYGSRSIAMPKNKMRGFIGQGLNGEITGFVGRIPEIRLGDAILKSPVVTFPDSISIAEATSEGERDGTLGSQLLNRFNLIFDVQNNLMYLKPNSNFKKRFSYNIAGIEIFQQNYFLRIPEVMIVSPGSPADSAGVKKGDQIMEINGRKTYEYNINEIRSIFETPARWLRLVLSRNDEEISVKIDMKSKI